MAETTYSNMGDPALIAELNSLTIELGKEVQNLREYGIKAAEAEKQYRIDEKKNALWLKEQGMSATMIDKVLKGYVAESLFQRDVARTLYETSKEKLQVIKVEIRVLENQIDREWRG